MSTTSRYAFQSPSVSNEKGAYRMRPPRSSRPGSNPYHFSDPSSHTYLHVPYRRTRRLAMLVALLACGALICFACAYWLFTTRYGHLSPSVRILLGSLIRSYVVNAFQRTASELDAPPTTHHTPPQDPTKSHQFDITFDTLDEPNTRLNALRADLTTAYLAYLPHSGLYNQRIALENALTLAQLLNRTLLVPPTRLSPKTLRYVHSSTRARMLRLSDKRQGRSHCAHIPADVLHCATLVPWAWLAGLRPIATQQALVRALNGTVTWIEEWLEVRPNETLFLPDTEPYGYQFVDTPRPHGRAISISA
ncbi:hypothetical protein J3R83DRAFT_7557 [Lanmaoa asiatica]|nr:hypothetical protein J3R83DRAFT_7557 [Lanmaoa asiatica]